MTIQDNKYNLLDIDYSVSGWAGLLGDDIQILNDVIHTYMLATAGEAFNENDTLYVSSDGKWYKAKADGTQHPSMAISTQSAAVDQTNIKIQLSGIRENTGWSWTPGDILYLSDSVEGGLTTTIPSIYAEVFAVAVSATEILIIAEKTASSGKRKVIGIPYNEANEITCDDEYELIDSSVLSGNISVGSTTVINGGIIMAPLAGAVGTAALTAIQDEFGNYLNMVEIRDSETNDPLLTVENRVIYGLLQCANTVTDGNSIGGVGSENCQISFVYVDENSALNLITVEETIGFQVNKVYYEWATPSIYKEGGTRERDIVAAQDVGPLLRHFKVTSPFAADEEINLITGNGSISGTATHTGDAVGLNSSAAIFSLDDQTQIIHNGVRTEKGVESIWDSVYSFHFTIPLNTGEWFDVEARGDAEFTSTTTTSSTTTSSTTSTTVTETVPGEILTQGSTHVWSSVDENLYDLVDITAIDSFHAVALHHDYTTNNIEAQVMEVDNGDYETITEKASLYTVSNANINEIMSSKIDDNHILVAYSSSSNLIAEVLEINPSTKQISSPVSAFTVYSGATVHLENITVIDSNHALVTFYSSGYSTQHRTEVIEINLGTWALSIVGAGINSIDGDANPIHTAGLVAIDADHFLIAYKNDSTGNATLSVLELDRVTYNLSEPGVPHSVNTSKYNFHDNLHRVDATHFVLFDSYGVTGTRGTNAFVFEVNTGTWGISTTNSSLNMISFTGHEENTRSVSFGDGLHYQLLIQHRITFTTVSYAFKVDPITYSVNDFDSDTTYGSGTNQAVAIDVLIRPQRQTGLTLTIVVDASTGIKISAYRIEYINYTTTTTSTTTSSSSTTSTTMSISESFTTSSTTSSTTSTSTSSSTTSSTYSQTTTTTLPGEFLLVGDIHTWTDGKSSSNLVAEALDDTHVVVAHRSLSTGQKAQVMEISNVDWSTITEKSSAFTFAMESQILQMVKVDSTHILSLYADYSVSPDDVYVEIIEANASTYELSTPGNALVIDSANDNDRSQGLWMVDGDHAIACYNLNASPWNMRLQIIGINTSTWDVSEVGSSLDIVGGSGGDVGFVQIDSTHWLITWLESGTLHLQARVLEINASTYAMSWAGSQFEVTTLATNYLYDNLHAVANDRFAQFCVSSTFGTRTYILYVDTATWAVSLERTNGDIFGNTAYREIVKSVPFGSGEAYQVFVNDVGTGTKYTQTFEISDVDYSISNMSVIETVEASLGTLKDITLTAAPVGQIGRSLVIWESGSSNTRMRVYSISAVS